MVNEMMKKLCILVFCVLFSVYALCSCGWIADIYIALDVNSQYYKKANWNCDDETFVTKYNDVYYQEIQRLKDHYDLSFSERIDTETNDQGNIDDYTFYLYCEEYTIYLRFSNSHTIGFYDARLYYYGDGEFPDSYDEFRPLVDFINDITNYVAYDTKTDGNHFEQLYDEAVNSEGGWASDEYHHDSVIGSVSYYVDLDYSAGYYYMAAKDSSIEKKCYRFDFEGLLKPL